MIIQLFLVTVLHQSKGKNIAVTALATTDRDKAIQTAKAPMAAIQAVATRANSDSLVPPSLLYLRSSEDREAIFYI